MRRYIKYGILFVACMGIMAGAAAQEKTVKIMERFQARMQEYVAVEMQIGLTGVDVMGASLVPQQSQIYFQGKDYALINKELEIYVQDKVKWTYMPGIEEAVVSANEASNGDLLDNPLILFSPSLLNFYALDNKALSGQQDGEEFTELICKPLDKRAAYSALHIFLRSRDLQPLRIKFVAKDGAWYQADITQFLVKDTPFPAPRFNFSPEAHPGVYITDLR